MVIKNEGYSDKKISLVNSFANKKECLKLLRQFLQASTSFPLEVRDTSSSSVRFGLKKHQSQ